MLSIIGVRGIPIRSYISGNIKSKARIDTNSPPAAPNKIKLIFFFFNLNRP